MDTFNTILESVKAVLVSNSKLQLVTVHGREFAIANIKIIVPGVLAGSKGPLFYPANQVAKETHIDSWNGKDLVVYHPVNSDGKPISATTPEVFTTTAIGRVFNAQLDEADGGIRVEGWFDREITQKVDNRIWMMLQAGMPIEVSTGLYTEQLKAPANSSHNGKSYTHIAMNYRPNHLAILPDQRGACSLLDGCGVFNTKTDYPEKCPHCDAILEIDPDSGICNRCGKHVEKMMVDNKDLINNPAWVQDHDIWMKAKMKAQEEGKAEDWDYIAGIYKHMGGHIGGGMTDNKDGPHKYSFVSVSLTGNLRERILGLGKKVEDDDLAEDGRENDPHVTILYGLHTNDPNEIKPYLEGFGKISLNVGKVSIFSGEDSGKDYDVLKLEITSDDLHSLNTKLKSAPNTNSYPTYNPHITIAYVKKGLGEQYAQSLNREIDAEDNVLGTNLVGVRNHYQTDEVVFSNMEGTKTTIKLVTKDTPESLILQPTENTMDRTKAIEWLVGNCDCYKSAEGKDKLTKLTDNEFKAVLMQNARKAVENDDSVFLGIIANSSVDIQKAYFDLMKKQVTPAIETPKPAPTPVNNTVVNPITGTSTPNNPTVNTTQMTDEDFIKTAPPGIVRLINNAKRVEEREKQILITKLTANMKDADKRNAYALKLNATKDIPELEEMLALLPTGNQGTNNNNQQRFQFLDANGPTDNSADDDISNDILDIPVINWEEEEKAYTANRKH